MEYQQKPRSEQTKDVNATAADRLNRADARESNRKQAQSIADVAAKFFAGTRTEDSRKTLSESEMVSGQ